ncbi:MAG: hypothetical protein JW880_06680 [Candidatus Thermoplasmatota archaeon]|nr:hypothetical protein [Candidatus Thermoplasmatota archaeon]
MTTRKIEAEVIRYPKHWFALLAVVFESVLLYLFAAALLNRDTVIREFWLVFCPIAAALLFLFLVPPIVTNHLAGERAIRIRMGLLINQSIPYDWIDEVKETSVNRGGLRVGIGVRYFTISKLLFVTSGFSSVVLLKLDGEHEVGRLWKRKVEDIVLSVSNLPRFMEVMRSRIGTQEDG